VTTAAGRSVVIWGAGTAGQHAAGALERVDAFVDADPAKWHTRVNGLPVWSPADLAQTASRPFVVVCSLFANEIVSQLAGMGFVEEVDFTTVGSAAAPVSKEGSSLEVFTRIYEDNQWGSEHSRSGWGSSPEATEAIRERIRALLRELGVRTLLDAPCGDFAWMALLQDAIPHYIGVDVVPELVRENVLRYGSDTVAFLERDLITDALPAADLILCRDCLVHLTLRQAIAVLHNFRRSGARYLLTTTFPEYERNHDIATGAWRPLNLTRAPFSWPDPIELLTERCTDDGAFADKALGLWDLRDLSLPRIDDVQVDAVRFREAWVTARQAMAGTCRVTTAGAGNRILCRRAQP
jgi:hypothetical protein